MLYDAPPPRSRRLAFVLFRASGYEARMAELLEMGWVDPVRTGAEEYLFRSRDVYRIQKLMRLCRDLEIPFGAGSIIVDLLERVERLEREISELKQLL